MTKPIIEKKIGCIETSLKVIGNKWSALLIRELMAGPRRFVELQKSVPGISPRTLSQRLDEMEEIAIVSKQIFAEVPPRVVYTLTERGTDLAPILQQMADWGFKHYTTGHDLQPKVV